jgi:hypothetical protein
MHNADPGPITAKMPEEIVSFLAQFDEAVFNNAALLRDVLLANLPAVIEQLDKPARMIAYCYGQKYAEMICMMIPSKKGLKLSFYQGTSLPDPAHLLEGNAKLTRYIEISSGKLVRSAALKKIIRSSLAAYKTRMEKPVGNKKITL